MQRHLLAVFQVRAFTPKNRNNRLRCRVKGDLALGVCHGDFPLYPAFHKAVHLAVLHFIALFAKLIDKGHHLLRIVHGLGIVHNQPALPVAQPLSVFFR